MKRLAPLVLLAACAAPSDDPAKGGFLNGVRNVQDGTYERRVTEKQAVVEAGKTEQSRLTGETDAVAAETAAVEAEIAAKQGELADVKREVLRLRAALRAAAKPVPQALETRVMAATTAKPDGPDPATKLAALQKAIADTRLLAEDLSKLAS